MTAELEELKFRHAQLESKNIESMRVQSAQLNSLPVCSLTMLQAACLARVHEFEVLKILLVCWNLLAQNQVLTGPFQHRKARVADGFGATHS